MLTTGQASKYYWVVRYSPVGGCGIRVGAETISAGSCYLQLDIVEGEGDLVRTPWVFTADASQAARWAPDDSASAARAMFTGIPTLCKDGPADALTRCSLQLIAVPVEPEKPRESPGEPATPLEPHTIRISVTDELRDRAQAHIHPEIVRAIDPIGYVVIGPDDGRMYVSVFVATHSGKLSEVEFMCEAAPVLDKMSVRERAGRCTMPFPGPARYLRMAWYRKMDPQLHAAIVEAVLPEYRWTLVESPGSTREFPVLAATEIHYRVHADPAVEAAISVFTTDMRKFIARCAMDPHWSVDALGHVLAESITTVVDRLMGIRMNERAASGKPD